MADVDLIPGANLVGVSADEGGYVWAVSHAYGGTTDYIHLLRPGATRFESFPVYPGKAGPSGHLQDGVLSVAGGAPGEAWVGYAGLFQNGESDDLSVPESIRQSGGADHFVATSTGIRLERHVMFWTPAGVLKNEPTGRWKVRSIFRIVYNHGPSGVPGDVFFGGTHGTAMVHADGMMEEHQHAGWNYCTSPDPDSCSLMAGDHHGVAIHPPTGNVWIAADFATSFVGYMIGDVREANGYHSWWNWTMKEPYYPSWAESFRVWEGLSADPQHPEWGGRDFTQALTFDAYGNLWIGGYFNGIARVKTDPATGKSLATKRADVAYWNNRFGNRPPWPSGDNIWTLQGDPDGSLWVGGPWGAYRFVEATNQWVSYRPVLPGNNVGQISLDPRPGVRAVYFATNGGLVIYRGK